MKVSSLVVGLTIVSFGTSFPELVVSLDAALNGYPDIAMGNVVGSNIANLTLVLGLTVFIFPLAVSRSILTVDWPLMLIVSLTLVAVTWDLTIQRWEGALLFGGIVFYNIWVIRSSRKNQKDIEETESHFKSEPADLIRTILLLVLSLSGLIWGADLLVDGAVGVAREFNIEERIIAITVIAFGTSAPELATSLIAVYRRQDEISLGNLIGSNIFNILGILGTTSILSPIYVNPKIKSFDFLFMVGIPLLIFPLILFKKRLSKWEGLLLIFSYIIYIFLIF